VVNLDDRWTDALKRHVFGGFVAFAMWASEESYKAHGRGGPGGARPGGRLAAWVAWRLEMPHVTEARCGACTVTGGCEVTTDAEAREYSSAMLPPRLVEVGEILEEEPCVNLDLYQKTFPGRECPRVELDVENEEAATLVQMRIGEDPLDVSLLRHRVRRPPARGAGADAPARDARGRR
jgi:hypothetical protein